MASFQTLLQKLVDFSFELNILLKFYALSHVDDFGDCQRFLVFYCFPIDALEERMRFDLAGALCAQSMHEIFVEKLTDEIFGLRRDHPLLIAHLRPFNIEICDIVDDLLYGLCAKRTCADHDLVSHYT